jgi:hypothetical protein
MRDEISLSKIKIILIVAIGVGLVGAALHYFYPSKLITPIGVGLAVFVYYRMMKGRID